MPWSDSLPISSVFRLPVLARCPDTLHSTGGRQEPLEAQLASQRPEASQSRSQISSKPMSANDAQWPIQAAGGRLIPHPMYIFLHAQSEPSARPPSPKMIACPAPKIPSKSPSALQVECLARHQRACIVPRRNHISISPSAMASRCLAVLAFLLLIRRFLAPLASGSPLTGVAVPEGLLPSSKCPSPAAS